MVLKMHVLLQKYRKAVRKTANYFKKAGIRKAVFGLSAGLDSTITALLLIEALGEDNVFALIMPSRYTKKQDIKDAIEFCKKQSIAYKVCEIDKIVKEIEGFGLAKTRLAKANIVARIRMILLYCYANSDNALVAGTSNKTELTLGYFTKYGDGAADIFPIAGFYKTELFELAKLLGVPEKIIRKRPSAGLWKGQYDEKELGLSYREIDPILKLIEEKVSEEEILKRFPKAKRVLELVKANAHKRKQVIIS